jgi:hypothetical protein
MALVYKITNKVTNKAYVGYTDSTFEWRLDQHFKAAEKYEGSSRKFYNSIQKHGTGCWTAETLYEGLTVEQVGLSADMVKKWAKMEWALD